MINGPEVIGLRNLKKVVRFLLIECSLEPKILREIVDNIIREVEAE